MSANADGYGQGKFINSNYEKEILLDYIRCYPSGVQRGGCKKLETITKT